MFRLVGKLIYPVLLLTLMSSMWTSSHAQKTLPEDHAKYETVQQVLDDLIFAVDDGRTPPELRMTARGVESRNQILWFNPDHNVLTLQEEVYDLCAALGPDSLNALSFLLGHELAHLYKDHDWVGDFGNSFANLEVGKKLNQLSLDPKNRAAIEAEADHFGGFYSSISGYAPFDVMPTVLERIYAAYGLREDIPGYPSLTERQEIARRARDQLKEMVPVFKAGHLLLLTKRYEEAGRCFDYIARTFPSREILNNAGLARVLQALDLVPDDAALFAYPFEFDARTRLSSGATKQSTGEIDWLDHFDSRKKFYRRLEQAGKWFDRARAKDPGYISAYINLAGVADLQGEYEEAFFRAQKAIKMARHSEAQLPLAHALIMRGIARIHGDPPDREGALQDFDRARAGSPSLAHLNLEALDRSETERADPSEAECEKRPEERIDGRGAHDFQAVISDPASETEVPGIDNEQPALDIYTQQTETWNALVIEARYSIFSFLEARPGYEGKTEAGIQVGHDRLQVEAAYGQPDYLVMGRHGVYNVYENARIIFQTDAGGAVQGWIVYTSQ